MSNQEQLSRIKIKGYKSIKECDILLNSINVLIGSNGAGKSNFISSLFLVQNVIIKNLQVMVGKSGVNSMFYKGIKITEEISFELFFGNNSYGFVLIPTDDNRVIFKKEFFTYHGQWDNESNVGRGHVESLWDKGAGNKLDQYVQPLLDKQKWRVYHFHDTSKNARVKQENNISNNKYLMNDAGNLASFLYKLKKHHNKEYELIVSTIKLVAPYFDDFLLEPQEGNSEQIILKWYQKECEDVFNASQLSDGTIRFICIATLLLQPKELRPATIIIDEPELGLHPYAITIFSELVKSISEETQVILSTQSVELLNEFDVKDVVVVDRNNQGSKFKKLDEDELRLWIEKDYTLGELWKKNILGGRLS